MRDAKQLSNYLCVSSLPTDGPCKLLSYAKHFCLIQGNAVAIKNPAGTMNTQTLTALWRFHVMFFSG